MQARAQASRFGMLRRPCIQALPRSNTIELGHVCAVPCVCALLAEIKKSKQKGGGAEQCELSFGWLHFCLTGPKSLIFELF